MNIWDLVMIGLGVYSGLATIAVVCLWFESCYWMGEAERNQTEVLRLQQDLGDSRDEANSWECRCQQHERVA